MNATIRSIATAPASSAPSDFISMSLQPRCCPAGFRQIVILSTNTRVCIRSPQGRQDPATQRAEPEDQQLCTGSLFGPHQTSILNNQRGAQFDGLIALVRARRPHSIWHLDNARSRVATHIRAEQTPGLMQSACHEALALAAARVAPMKKRKCELGH
jgi:hypothetical protein